MTEIMCKLYLELANVVPLDCISAREIERLEEAEAIIAKWREFGRISQDGNGKWISASIADPAGWAQMKAAAAAWFIALAKAEEE